MPLKIPSRTKDDDIDVEIDLLQAVALVGFKASGVAAGSLAAGWQASIGESSNLYFAVHVDTFPHGR